MRGLNESQLTPGQFKFNAMLEWLLSHMDGAAPKQTAASTEPDAKSRRQAKLDEAERKDKARREEKAAKEDNWSKVDAPDAVPEEAAEHPDTPISHADAPEPEPAEIVEEGVEAQETRVHEEL